MASGVERSRASPVASPGAPIRFAAVSKAYRTSGGDTIRALEDVSLSIASGEFVSLVGPSGCGKSTLLKILAGLTPPTAGAATIAGASAPAALSDIGFVFQEATLLPWLTVLRNVLVPADVARIPRAADAAARTGVARPRRSQRLSRQVPQRAFGRHAAARGDLPGPAARPQDPADGRAVRRAGCADPRSHEHRAAAHLGRPAQHGAVRHAQHQRGRAARATASS